MGLLSRFTRVVKAKLNVFVSSQEDPREQLEFAYEQMRDKQHNMKSSIADVKAARKRLERKQENFREQIEEHNQQARAAMEQGREDLAEAALKKKKSKENAITDLQGQIDEMDSVEDDMREQLQEIDSRVSELKTQKEVLKARYSGAESMEEVSEMMAEGLGDYSVEDAVGDVEEDILDMQTRAEAINELEEENTSVEDELSEISVDSEVSEEMDTLRKEVELA